MTMIKTVFNLLKIHWKMVLGNTAVIVQDMLRKTPKSFDTVDMILGPLVDQALRMVDGVVFAQPLQRIVAPKGVRIVDRSFPCFLSDDCHKFFLRHMLHHLRVDPAVALQKPKYNAFTLGTSSTLSLSLTAEVGFVKFDLAREFLSLKLGNMVDRFTKALIDSRDRLIIRAKIVRQAVRRLLLVEALHYGNFLFQLFEGLLFSTGLASTPDVPATRFRDLERSAPDTLLTSQKVGCATENVLLLCNHKDILNPLGYYCH